MTRLLNGMTSKCALVASLRMCFLPCWNSADGSGVRVRVGSHHRTLSTYLNTIIQVGFRVERLVEPRASGPGTFRYHAAYEKLPPALIVRCRKD